MEKIATRKLDSLNRLVIPRAGTEEFDLVSGSALEIYVDKENRTFVLKPAKFPEGACFFCGSDKVEVKVGDKRMCEHCFNELINNLSRMKPDWNKRFLPSDETDEAASSVCSE